MADLTPPSDDRPRRAASPEMIVGVLACAGNCVCPFSAPVGAADSGSALAGLCLRTSGSAPGKRDTTAPPPAPPIQTLVSSFRLVGARVIPSSRNIAVTRRWCCPAVVARAQRQSTEGGSFSPPARVRAQDQQRGIPMYRKYLLATALVVAFAVPSFAATSYYVAQDAKTHNTKFH